MSWYATKPNPIIPLHIRVIDYTGHRTAESRRNGAKPTITLDDKRRTSNHRNSLYPLQTTIFNAEIFAILKATENLKHMHRKTVIMTDSLSSLTALERVYPGRNPIRSRKYSTY
jgi:hypothetical protein